MITYNVYRSIRSNDGNGWQLIAKIDAEDYNVALTRAKFIPSFYNWEGKTGIVVNESGDTIQHSTTDDIEHITASHCGNATLKSHNELIMKELEAHSRRMAILEEEHQDLLSVM